MYSVCTVIGLLNGIDLQPSKTIATADRSAISFNHLTVSFLLAMLASIISFAAIRSFVVLQRSKVHPNQIRAGNQNAFHLLVGSIPQTLGLLDQLLKFAFTARWHLCPRKDFLVKFFKFHGK